MCTKIGGNFQVFACPLGPSCQVASLRSPIPFFFHVGRRRRAWQQLVALVALVALAARSAACPLPTSGLSSLPSPLLKYSWVRTWESDKAVWMREDVHKGVWCVAYKKHIALDAQGHRRAPSWWPAPRPWLVVRRAPHHQRALRARLRHHALLRGPPAPHAHGGEHDDGGVHSSSSKTTLYGRWGRVSSKFQVFSLFSLALDVGVIFR